MASCQVCWLSNHGHRFDSMYRAAAVRRLLGSHDPFADSFATNPFRMRSPIRVCEMCAQRIAVICYLVMLTKILAVRCSDRIAVGSSLTLCWSNLDGVGVERRARIKRKEQNSFRINLAVVNSVDIGICSIACIIH